MALIGIHKLNKADKEMKDFLQKYMDYFLKKLLGS